MAALDTVAVGRNGFAVLAADEPGGAETAVRLAFDERTDTPDAVRMAMIELLRRARS
jgi:hypothetical protein